MYPTQIFGVNNLTITIDGTVRVSEDNINWPNETEGNCWDFWTFRDMDYLHIRGSGEIDGQGYWWWMREYVIKNHAGRPHLLRM
jgi:hypothetical protein